jgi:hypothetical protein
MPDSSLPPSWGPAPFDERDLDAVLSGETADIPLALRPVADTLAVLRGAVPTPAELRGEAAVMAEYRALGLGQPDGLAQTLVLPAIPAGRSPRRAARHRARRRRVPSVGRRAGALMGVAAAVLIGVVVASGNLSGPIEHITHLGRTSSPSPSATYGGNLQGTATPTRPAATHDPTPARGQAVPSATPSPSPGKLCREFYGYFTHPESKASRSAEMSLYEELARLAGSLNPIHFCGPYLGNMFHDGDSGTGPQGSQDQGSQNQQGSQSQGKAPANAAKAKPSPAASPAPTGQGATSSSNANGNSGPGQDSKGGGPASNS